MQSKGGKLMTLPDRIARVSEFEEKALRPRVRDAYRSIFKDDPPFKEEVDQGLKCMEMENARLRPLIAALGECVRALALEDTRYRDRDANGEEIEGCYRADALAQLERTLEEYERGKV
jgi:hypothetical protein